MNDVVMNVAEKALQKEKLTKLAKYGVIGLAGLLFAPIAFMTIGGMIGLGVAAIVAYIGYSMAPVVAVKIANAKYRALDAERVDHIAKVQTAAAENPIETLIIQSQQKRDASDKFKLSITTFRTEVKNFEDQLKTFAREYPEDVDRFKNQLEAMNKLLAFRESRYKQLQVELDNFDEAIKRAQAMWKMSQAAQKMNKMAGMEVGDQFEKIKADSAINSVMTSMNRAFSEMETALLDNKEVQQAVLAVENNESPALIADSQTITSKVTV